jgi:hypothetical protein
MNGADIGTLGVYVHERDASLGTAALEITGDQRNQWNQKLWLQEDNHSLKYYYFEYWCHIVF